MHLQGCNLKCPGCFNAATHDPSGGNLLSVDSILEGLIAAIGRGETETRPLEGVTISGGEPLQQSDALVRLLEIVRRETTLSVILFSGYTMDEIRNGPGRRVLQFIDILVDGRYDSRFSTHRGLMGSTNQVVHALTDRYKVEDIVNLSHDYEVCLTPDGGVITTGFPPNP